MQSGVVPVVRCGKRLELVIDEKLKRPIVAITGRNADEMCSVLAKRFLTRHNSDGEEILVPLQAFPTVGVWIMASYRVKPSEELLDKLLLSIPTLLTDLFWELIDISNDIGRDDNKPLISQPVLLKASKIMRELLRLYKVM